jgi:thiol:disulfide interchange protein DsbD
VFSKPEIKNLFKQYELVELYTDKIPSRYLKDASRQQEYARINQDFQDRAFGTIQLPLYVILEPQPDGKIKVLGQYEEGKINDTEGFIAFLKRPFGENQAHAQAGR